MAQHSLCKEPIPYGEYTIPCNGFATHVLRNPNGAEFPLCTQHAMETEKRLPKVVRIYPTAVKR